MIDLLKPHDFPEYGARVTLTRYRDGSARTGDLPNPDLVATGTVVETPRSGSRYLVVKTERPVAHELQRQKSAPEAWSTASETISLSVEDLQAWTIEPAKPQAAVITAVIDLRGLAPEHVALVLRGSLRQMGCELIPHTYGPDVDTVADCAGVESVTAIEIA